MSITLYPAIGSSASTPASVEFGGTQVDAFGRLRVSEPFTLFDSQSRYQADPEYDTSTATGGTATYVSNRAAVDMAVTTTSGSSVVKQTYRVFPYQPGKSLLIMQTFTMAAGKTNLRQRIGFFGADNGIYFQQNDTTLSFVIRTYTGGSVDDSRSVSQSSWNGDKLNGTGPSGYTLDVTKTQILWMDIEWLGVGSVRCGFVIDGKLITAHTFHNANSQSNVYMQTAILPLRYEITNTGTTASSSTMQQICSTVISEGGYEQVSQPYVARVTSTSGVTVGTSFVPLVSIRLNSSYLGAVVIPAGVLFLPIGTGNYEVALIKNATLTGATWAAGALSGGQVDVDLAATALTNTDDNIVQIDYATASRQAKTSIIAPTGYNFALQLGVSLAGVSDTYTLAARTYSGTNACTGSLSFWNLTV